MDLDVIWKLAVTGYTLWKWFTEYQDRKAKQKERPSEPAKHKKKRSR